MLRKTPFVVAYHGTTKTRAADILRKKTFQKSQRDGLWLGEGAYFFQDAPAHALNWARQKSKEENDEPAVFVAEIDIRKCFDLTDRRYWPLIISVWEEHSKNNPRGQLGIHAIFENLSLNDKATLGRHLLDCDVMNRAIEYYQNKGRAFGLEITTVRASFVEEGPIFRDSWLWTGSCTMISVLNPSAILQYEPLELDEAMRMSDLNSATRLPDAPNSSVALDGQIAGVWGLVSHSSQMNGTKLKTFGDAPSGLMIIDKGGYVSMHIHDPNRARFSSNSRRAGTPEENRSAVQGTISNFGRLTVNETDRTFVIHIMGSSFPNADNTHSVRSISLTGDELRCVTTDTTSGGGIVEQIWRRIG